MHVSSCRDTLTLTPIFSRCTHTNDLFCSKKHIYNAAAHWKSQWEKDILLKHANADHSLKLQLSILVGSKYNSSGPIGMKIFQRNTIFCLYFIYILLCILKTKFQVILSWIFTVILEVIQMQRLTPLHALFISRLCTNTGPLCFETN